MSQSLPRCGLRAALAISLAAGAVLFCTPAWGKRTEDGRVVLRLANPERVKRAEMGRRGKQVVHRDYNDRSVAGRLLEVYRTCMDC